MLYFVELRLILHDNTQLTLVTHKRTGGHIPAVAIEAYGDTVERMFFELQLNQCLAVSLNRIDRHDAVAPLQSRQISHVVRHHRVDNKRYILLNQHITRTNILLVLTRFLTLLVIGLVEHCQTACAQVFGHSQRHSVLATQHRDVAFALQDDRLDEIVQLLGLLSINSEQMVVLLKAFLQQHLREIESVGHVLKRQLVRSPLPQHHREDDQRTNEINQYTAQDDEEALPRRFGAELPRLGLSAKLIGRMGLIDHTAYSTVSAKRQPAYTPLGVIRVLGPLVVLVLRQELNVPLAVELLKSHQTDPWVEEQIELLHTHMENLGKREMSQLVNQHEKGQR